MKDIASTHSRSGARWRPFTRPHVGDVPPGCVPIKTLSTPVLDVAAMIVLSTFHRVAPIKFLNHAVAMWTKPAVLRFVALILLQLVVPRDTVAQCLVATIGINCATDPA